MCLIISVFALAGPVTRTAPASAIDWANCLKEGVILRGMPAPDRVCLVVDVFGRVIRVQHEPFHVGWAEMEYACLMMIDPDSRMKVTMGHE